MFKIRNYKSIKKHTNSIAKIQNEIKSYHIVSALYREIQINHNKSNS